MFITPPVLLYIGVNSLKAIYLGKLITGVGLLIAVTYLSSGIMFLCVNGRVLTDMSKRGEIKVNPQILHKTYRYYSILSIIPNGSTDSKRIKIWYKRRNDYIRDYMHKSAKRIIDYAIQKGIKLIVIGYNKEWAKAIKRNSGVCKLVLTGEALNLRNSLQRADLCGEFH